eukprot:146854_1
MARLDLINLLIDYIETKALLSVQENHAKVIKIQYVIYTNIKSKRFWRGTFNTGDSVNIDENFLIYDSIYSTPVSGNTSIIGEPDHEIDSDDEYEHDYEEDIDTVCDQNERIKCLYKLSELIMNNDG